MSAPHGYPVEGAGCDCVWIGNGVLYSACAGHRAWRDADVQSERERCAKIAATPEIDYGTGPIGPQYRDCNRIAFLIRNRASAQNT